MFVGQTRKKTRGMALILAMLIAAIAATVAVTLIDNQSRWMQSVETRRDYAQAKSLAVAGLYWATHVLDEDARQSQVDHLLESWAYPLPPTPIENGMIEGQIIDLQGKINLNSLLPGSRYRTETQRSLTRLAVLLNLDPALLTPVFARFAEPESPLSSVAAKKPEIPPMFDASELAALLPAAAFNKILAFVTALPEATPVNVNTATREVIAAMLPDLTEGEVTEFIEKRPFRSAASLRAALPGRRRNGAIAVASRYFFITVRAVQNQTESSAQAIVCRKESPEIIRRTVE
ncbi:MAG: type II secretion system minor pseudopilin GspK [Burkholderiales bacterium]|jgi:general secretion pathway protein K|nr:type II secretion system minor pseudopilin GspK [Burkholderiales bacterium]